MGLIFVDCEAYGGCPSTGALTEFGAVAHPSCETFHGMIMPTMPSPENPAVSTQAPHYDYSLYKEDSARVFMQFKSWIIDVSNDKGRPIFVSDNPAFDWQWINAGFLVAGTSNPFGHSARRISDFYAGLMNDWNNTQEWKRLRITKHDHNPVHAALGNLEAFNRLLAGER